MNELPFLRHYWIMFVAITVANALILKVRSRKYIAERPELAPDYRRFVLGVVGWGSLPWLVMGVGLETGQVPSLFSYLRPRDGNPFVLSWLGTAITLWMLGFYWIFACRGAEFLVEHPGLFRGDPKNPAMIRIGYGVLTIAGLLGAIRLFTMDVPGFVK